MNFSKINLFDIANGEGIRTSLFVSGCKFNCKGCFNPETHDFNFGKPFTDKEEEIMLDSINNEWFDGISILGGDPMWQKDEDLDILIDLCKKTHKLGKNVWLWTGFNFENLKGKQLELAKNCDIIVDGQFDINKKDLSLAFRGSSNQRILKISHN